MPDIRLLTEDDLDELQALLEYTFRWAHDQRNRTRLEHLVRHVRAHGLFEGGELASQIMALPFTSGFHGVKLPAAGVGFVGTYPEYRGRGFARDLMARIIEEEHERGTLLSYLAPFSYPFYRRFGYEHVFNQYAFRIKVGGWPDGVRVPGRVARLGWGEARPFVERVYAAGEPERPCGLVREAWWEEYKFHLRRDYDFAVYLDEDGAPQGYLAYQLNGTSLDIFELEWLTANAFQALSRYIRSHEAGFSLTWTCLDPGALERMPLPADPEPMAFTVRPYMMARIIDLEALLLAYPFEGEGDFTLGLQVDDDEFAPWNGGCYTLRRTAGTVSVERQDACGTLTAMGAPVPVIHASIQRLAQLLLGSHDLPQLLASGGLAVSGVPAARATAQLGRIIPTGRPAMEDYF